MAAMITIQVNLCALLTCHFATPIHTLVSGHFLANKGMLIRTILTHQKADI